MPPLESGTLAGIRAAAASGLTVFQFTFLDRRQNGTRHQCPVPGPATGEGCTCKAFPLVLAGRRHSRLSQGGAPRTRSAPGLGPGNVNHPPSVQKMTRAKNAGVRKPAPWYQSQRTLPVLQYLIGAPLLHSNGLKTRRRASALVWA